MLKIDRHPIDKEYVNQRLKAEETLLTKYEEVARTKPEQLPLESLAADTLNAVACLSVLKPDAAEIGQLLLSATQASTALFRQALSVGEHIQVTINGDLALTIPTTGSSSITNTDNWLIGFFVALVRRDIKALHVLANIPLEILRTSSFKPDEYVYLYVDVLQAVLRRDDDLSTRLFNALEATDPEKLEQGVGLAYALYIVVPALNLLLQLLSRNAPKFNQVLASALDAHKEFWSVNETTSRKPYGFIAWPLLAIASLAYDYDMPIEVESDYLPLRLLHGACRA
jgi:hypothetical protein